MMDYFNAFWVGGAICALVQILLDKTKLMPGRVMVLLVCTGAILGAEEVLVHLGGHDALRMTQAYLLLKPGTLVDGV